MTRKDSEKDAERPHYYSQFWLDIAAGRRVIGGPKPEDAEANEAEIPEPAPTRRAARGGTADGYKETRAAAVVAPVVEEEEMIEPADEEFPQEDLIDEADLPNIDLQEEDELPEDEDEFFEEEDEEEDEDWGTRGGRKKAKPTRPTKPIKKPKTRRGF